jgi:AraC-like DNA-binding protein
MLMQQPLLENFPVVRTRDVDEMCAWFTPVFAVREFRLPERHRPLDFALNHCALSSLSLTYVRYGARLHARLAQTDFFVQGFPLSGTGEVRWNRKVQEVTPASGGVAGSPGDEARIDYDGDFSHLIVKISPDAVTRRLSLLLGTPVDPPLKVDGQLDKGRAAAQARLVRFLAQELSRGHGRLPDRVLSELEDTVVVNYLLANAHNYSDRLATVPQAAAPWQVRRAVDYMEQHWDEAITIELLTRITETSARSLFQLFKKTHDVSPMVYLGKVRLRHAKEMLSAPAPGTSVTKVGFMCGFSNLGQFAMKYHGAYGERPSETLKNNRR